LFGLVATLSLVGFAAGAEHHDHHGEGPNLRGPYCGIYALHAAGRSFSVEQPIASLLQPAFVSSHHGSTANDLVEAAASLGLHARAFGGLTRIDLLAAGVPMILHVRSTYDAPEYDHWTLVLRADLGGADVLSDVGTIERVPLADLVTRWSGTAVAVDATPVSSWFRVPFWLGMIGVAAATGAVAFVGRSYVPEVGGGRAVLVGSGIILGGGVLASLVHAAVDPASLPRHDEARAGVVARNVGRFLPRVSTDELQRAVVAGRSLVIDARSPADYARGHVPTAVNVPTFASDATIEAALSIDSRQVILYCQSRTCDFAERVARRLHDLGHRNLAIYEAGFVAWEQGQLPVSRPGASR
jgi:rhodanese-related sulfurtransferase